MQPEHQELMERIDAQVRATAPTTGRRRLSPSVRAALARVPRHAFVPHGDRASAYLDRPLPIGHGQTISQPFIVAIMTELLDVEPDHVVLEVGTGCGYETAVLAELAARVDSIEVVEALAEDARRRLAALGYENVEIRHGDGAEGWPEHAPYERIIVTAAPERVPPALVAQLAPCGRMVLPVGNRAAGQDLVVIHKDEDGRVWREAVLQVAFVPLV